MTDDDMIEFLDNISKSWFEINEQRKLLIKKISNINSHLDVPEYTPYLYQLCKINDERKHILQQTIGFMNPKNVNVSSWKNVILLLKKLKSKIISIWKTIVRFRL